MDHHSEQDPCPSVKVTSEIPRKIDVRRVTPETVEVSAPARSRKFRRSNSIGSGEFGPEQLKILAASKQAQEDADAARAFAGKVESQLAEALDNARAWQSKSGILANELMETRASAHEARCELERERERGKVLQLQLEALTRGRSHASALAAPSEPRTTTAFYISVIEHIKKAYAAGIADTIAQLEFGSSSEAKTFADRMNNGVGEYIDRIESETDIRQRFGASGGRRAK